MTPKWVRSAEISNAWQLRDSEQTWMVSRCLRSSPAGAASSKVISRIAVS